MLKKFLIYAIGTSSVIMLGSIPAHAQRALTTVRVCTGPVGLTYEKVGQEIQKQSKGILEVTLITTAGSQSNADNIANGVCDTAIVQSDILYVIRNASQLEVGPVFYQEPFNLICNKNSGITRITDANSKTKFLIGANGGGTATTIQSFKKADPKRYENVPTEPIGGLRAAALVDEGSAAQCMALVAGLNSPLMKEINENSKATGNLRLIPADDKDLLNVKDSKGRLIYTQFQIPSGIYAGGLQPSAFFGSSVNTVAVNAELVTSTKFIDDHEDDYSKFLRIVNTALPSIKLLVQTK